MAKSTMRYSTAVEYISAELRQEILRGHLPPGERLILDVLAERFRTSPIPVREALRVLEAEGLIVMQAHRSAVVAEISEAELEDLYRVRMLIDVEAVRWSHGKLTEENAKTIHGMIDRMEMLLSSHRDFAAFNLHRDIHFRIYEPSGSPFLMEILRRLHAKSERFRHLAKPVRGSPKEVANEHRKLLTAMETGTAQEAANLMKDHLQRTLDSIKAGRSQARVRNNRSA
jgi:DNA-binding GntR family transcriptional regulator